MRRSSILAGFLLCIPSSLAFFDFGTPGSLGSLVSREFRTSWETFKDSALARPPQRHRLRRASTTEKCQLRLLHTHNSTSSPSPTKVSTSTSYAIPSTTRSSTSIMFPSTTSQTVLSSSTESPAQSTTSASRTSSSASPATSSSMPQPSSAFTLKQFYNGSSFFNGWNFYSNNDPTQGIVNYLDHDTAFSTGLVSINSAGHAIMKIDTTPVVSGNRNSIRIQSQIHFNGGLLMLDAVHMPHGCGTWPAFWMNGPHWPYTGEIDILEGVHDSTQNLVSLHTDNGCNVADNTGSTGVSVNGNSCSATGGANTGCGERVTTPNSYGSAFNSVNGGVYALLWDTTGLSVFWFPRASIPNDIKIDAPLPNTWGTPVARFPASACNPYQFFVDQTIIFDTTLCGTWAGSNGAWNLANSAGQGASCATSTGVSTCTAFVQNNGAAFADAYWEVVSVKLFQ
ncbi:concanavalin A-like lectin/glucanase domain-containing protein [Cantharellus anzutake]|uniref:concanavalin A-like lectin/glucanase domain-containing protein n=1 Tax=Cantharellus anzutake TaxID=1750568 RepID=UPI00190786AC|nr:concanavalin A-like lectin/glucanase domain-containing protein [Cantharellus anzutake]KAF8342799.1 concanavalin A-like lectin/glucanase domain-containing protein [Cantharellus anzutake]